MPGVRVRGDVNAVASMIAGCEQAIDFKSGSQRETRVKLDDMTIDNE
jgi:hypothetical protein